MRFSGLSEIRAYWEALRGTAPIPRRAAFDPRGIERALPQSFLAARGDAPHPSATPFEAQGPLVLRITGQQVCALVGRDLRGAGPEALLAPPDRAALLRILEEVLDGPALAELELDCLSGDGAPQAARLLLLPLADAAGRVGYVLGGLAVQGGVPALRDHAPALSPLTLRTARLSRLAARDDGGCIAAPAATLPQGPMAAHSGPGLAEAAAPFAPPDPGRAHLRVVK
jgi:hypothetical protein